jgi:GT2 family glycosyltransferase
VDVSIVVPTWNGETLLARFLPPLLTEAERYRVESGARVEVIVVDDASTDGSRKLLQSLPVRCIERPSQGGFSRACNSGLEAAQNRWLVLLNNDVWVAPGFISAMLEPFADPEVFAVTACIYEPDTGLLATAGKIGAFRKGFWSVYVNFDVKPDNAEAALSAYAVGGFCALRTDEARSLGGFDELLSPFHWEDIDLSYRAWKRGWKVVYQPRAIGWHQASSTIGKAYSDRRVETVAVRNRLLFHWKNLHDPVMLGQHCAMLLLLLATRWLAGDFGFYRAFWKAAACIPQLRRLRRGEKLAARRSDRAVRNLLHAAAQRPDIEVFRNRNQVEKSHERLRSPDYSQ